MKDVIDKFYELSEALNDDYELILKFMVKHTHTKHKQKKLFRYIENANYANIETEIDEALTKVHLVGKTLFDFMEN